MKNLFAILSVFLMSLFLVGCDSDKSLVKVLSKGELVIGLDDSYPPMGFRDENGNIVGFDIDLANEVCARLGIKLKAKPISWDAKEQELNSGNIDCIWNVMSVDSSRAESMNLSDPYLKNGMFFVLKDSSLANYDSLMGRKIALQKGSTTETFLAASEAGKSAKEIVGFNDNLSALAALEQGDVDIVYLDEVIARYMVLKLKKNYILLEDRSAGEKLAIGFRKEDKALRDAVNDIVNATKKDGRFVNISMKWFGK